MLHTADASRVSHMHMRSLFSHSPPPLPPLPLSVVPYTGDPYGGRALPFRAEDLRAREGEGECSGSVACSSEGEERDGAGVCTSSTATATATAKRQQRVSLTHTLPPSPISPHLQRLMELEAKVAEGDRFYEQRTAAIRQELEIAKATAEQAKKECEVAVARERESLDEKDLVQRQHAESSARTISEIQRATRQSADEMRNQLSTMEDRVKKEIESTRKREREAAQEQLHRLLKELAEKGERMGELEARLEKAELHSKGAAAMNRHLAQMKEAERLVREALQHAAVALGLSQSKQNLPVHELCQHVIAKFQQVQEDIKAISAALDSALADVDATSSQNETLQEKVDHLLSVYNSQKREVKALRDTLDYALSKMMVNLKDKSSLDEKLKRLLIEYDGIHKSEQQMRGALASAGLVIHGISSY